MAGADDTYSRLVSWLKVLLPVMALVLLSVMFLIARSIDPNSAISYADVDVEDIAREQRMSRPSFSGVTDDGAAITFTADSAQPDPENPANYSASGLNARIETPDGAEVTIIAQEAQVVSDENMLNLSGGIELITSTDYTIHGTGLTARLDATWVETDGAVTADGPGGRVEAGQVTLSRQGGEGSPYLLVFKDGVKLVYVPQREKEE